MFVELHWPIKLPEMYPVLGNQMFSDKQDCAFECCLGQLNERFRVESYFLDYCMEG